jgi:hypothetical protein
MGNSLSLTHPEREDSFRSNRKIWLSIGPLAVLLLFLGIYGCTRALRSGSHEAYVLAEGLHASMAKQDWNGIYTNSDQGFKEAITAEKSAEMFAGIVRKLGAPVSCKQGGTSVNANTSGNIIESTCETSFTLNATGIETLTWHKSGGVYRLAGYNLTSDALVTR